MQAAHHNMQLMLASLQQVLAEQTADGGKAGSALEAVLRAAVVALLTHFSDVLELLQNPLHDFLLAQSFFVRVLCPQSKGAVREAVQHIEEVRVHMCCIQGGEMTRSGSRLRPSCDQRPPAAP